MSRAIFILSATIALSPISGAFAQARRANVETPAQVLAAANSAARQQASRDGFTQARHVFSYEPGALYEIQTNPAYVSTILLEPGEVLNDIAAGDTSRWMVTQAPSETGSQARTIVLVKPNAPGLRTNIVLITDRRTYLVEAVSGSGALYSAQIAWRYRDGPAPVVRAIDAANFNYRITTPRGRAPAWRPTRVFDDGARTWIEFASGAAAGDLPPLFVVSSEGVQLVNYRVGEGASGPRYEVDRIFDVAELRLGVRNPIIVRIERNPSPSAPPRRIGSRP